MDILLSVLAPLAEDQPDGPTANEWDDPEEFVEEQGLMGRVIHMLRSPNPGNVPKIQQLSQLVTRIL